MVFGLVSIVAAQEVTERHDDDRVVSVSRPLAVGTEGDVRSVEQTCSVAAGVPAEVAFDVIAGEDSFAFMVDVSRSGTAFDCTDGGGLAHESTDDSVLLTRTSASLYFGTERASVAPAVAADYYLVSDSLVPAAGGNFAVARMDPSDSGPAGVEFVLGYGRRVSWTVADARRLGRVTVTVRLCVVGSVSPVAADRVCGHPASAALDVRLVLDPFGEQGFASVRLLGSAEGEDAYVVEPDSGATALVRVLVELVSPAVADLPLRYGAEPVPGGALGTGPARDFIPVDRPGSRSVVPLGHRSVILPVTHIVGDDRIEVDEEFRIWVVIEELPASEYRLPVTILDDEPESAPGFIRVEFPSPNGFLEGDPPPGIDCSDRVVGHLPEVCSPGQPIVLYATDRLPEDLVYDLSTVAETARPGFDYVPIRQRRLELHEGGLQFFDPTEPLRLRIIPDLLSEPGPPELFHLVLRALVPGEAEPYFVEIIPIPIEDDDAAAGGFVFGVAGSEPCSAGGRVLHVDEPPPDSGSPFVAAFDLSVWIGSSAASPDGCSVPDKRLEFVPRLVRGGSAGAAPADPGADLVLVSRSLRFFPGETAVLELLIFPDELAEGAEVVDVAIGGRRLVVRIADYQVDRVLEAGRQASFLRYGRLLGAEMADSLAARFACASAAACSGGDAAPAFSYPAGPSRSVLMARFAGLLRSFAPSAGSDGSAVPFAPPAGPGFAPGLLRSVGRAADGLFYQGDPLQWANGASRRGPTPWSLWFRSSWREVSDSAPTGRLLRTSLLTGVGGLDRAVGALRVGGLFGLALGRDGLRYAHVRRGFPGAAGWDDRPTRWYVAAPYVGFVPHARSRLWLSVGRAWGGVADPPVLVSETAHPLGVDSEWLFSPRVSMSLVGGGGSVTVTRFGGVGVDLEADLFRAAVAPSTEVVRRARVTADGPAAVGAAAGSVVEQFEIPVSDAAAVSRRRLGVRFGSRVGGPSVASHLSVALAHRWDAGADVAWVWSGDAGTASPAAVSASDVSVDYRFQPVHRRFAFTVRLQLQVGGGVGPAAAGPPRGSSRSVALDGGFRWGASETQAGWAFAVRPAYGVPNAGLPGWWRRDVLSPAGLRWLQPVPALDAEAAYAFANGARLALTAGRRFGAATVPAAGVGAGVRFDRRW